MCSLPLLCYAVIFSGVRREGDDGYAAKKERMPEPVRGREGFLGVESARDGIGITVSCRRGRQSIARWEADAEHRAAQEPGRKMVRSLPHTHRQSRRRESL